MITIWQLASLPFWALAVAFPVAEAAKHLGYLPKSAKCLACALIASGLAAYIAARIAS